jgi:hypothetical protein
MTFLHNIFSLSLFRMGDVTLKFPKKFEKAAKSLTAPKPDVLFGAYINRASAKLNRRKSKDPGIYSIHHFDLEKVLSAQEYSEIGCGATGERFCFPTVAIERKSDSGSLYFVQNQLLGSLCCIYEAQKIARLHFSPTLPHLAIGIANVGHNIEVWAMWPKIVDDKVFLHSILS